jgi:hypothetical protein
MPDLCEITLPNIKAYAKKIGAEFHLITDRWFPNWPVTYEKMQVHQRGLGADWNILVDADFLLHPDLPDFTQMLQQTHVGIHYGFDWQHFFEADDYFLRQPNKTGIVSSFLITSRLTHDLWRPLNMDLQTALTKTKRHFIIDEYALTRNLHKYGLNYVGVEFSPAIAKMMVHLGNEEKTPMERAMNVEAARNTLQAWGVVN